MYLPYITRGWEISNGSVQSTYSVVRVLCACHACMPVCLHRHLGRWKERSQGKGREGKGSFEPLLGFSCPLAQRVLGHTHAAFLSKQVDLNTDPIPARPTQNPSLGRLTGGWTPRLQVGR